MKATMLNSPGNITLDSVTDATIVHPTDAVVRVVAACVCGSDLWPYRGISPLPAPRRMGHEFVGIVEAVGAEVRGIHPGQFVIAPFATSDGTCPQCINGITTSCDQGAFWGSDDQFGTPFDGGQGEYVRVPLADGTLVATPDQPDEEMIPHLLTLSDVMATGHHAAVSAGVHPGATVVVVGDGAVGLCAVLASVRQGAQRVIVMSSHADRQEIATQFGATDIVSTRGREGVEEIHELLGGAGADCALECVGTKDSMNQAVRSVRPGGQVGYVGVPAGGPELPISHLFSNNIGVNGGVAPARVYIPALLADVLAGDLRPGAVFDLSLPLADVASAYTAMDERRAIKALLWPA